MESSRYTVFVKVTGYPDWIEHMTFYERFDAENYAAALKMLFPRIEDYCVRETAKREERRFG